jgi:uncharacterized protein YkwD
MVCKIRRTPNRKVKNRHIRIERFNSLKSILTLTSIVSTSIVSTLSHTVAPTISTVVAPTISTVVAPTISTVAPTISTVVAPTISTVAPTISTVVPSPTILNLPKLLVSDITQTNIDSLLQLQNTERRLNNLTDFTWSESMSLEALTWSKNLAENQCNLQHYLDTARGQNLFGVYGSTTGNINTAVNAWINEKNLIGNVNVTSDQIGHYLIVISSQLSQVGCGIVANIDQNCIVSTCNYI